MSYKSTDFPQYRKLSNEKVFYRIRTEREFDELQLIGTKGMWFSMQAEQYPEILKIQDLLNCFDSGTQMSDEEEFRQMCDQYGLTDKK